MTQSQAIIHDAIRTPRGRGRADGSLNEVTPISLITGLIHEMRHRNPDLDPRAIDDLVLGVVTPVLEQGMDIAKIAATAARLPETVAGVQINRFCASGLEAVNQAAARVRSGFEDLLLAGGVESMSRVPMGSDGGAWMGDPDTAEALGFVPQGISADLLATRAGIGRGDVDAYAVESHHRAARAREEGRFSRSLIPVRDPNGLTILAEDEIIRPDANLEALSRLRPSFAEAGAMGYDEVALCRHPDVERIDHIHHPGNSSGIVDGASLVLVGTEETAARHGLPSRARIRATAVSAAEPTIMLTGPVPAVRKALDRAGMAVSDVDLWELNEAFAAVPLWFMSELGIDHDALNVNGGAIAMGHPLGATGAMILGILLDELERRDLTVGVATLCAAGGMGIATVIERI